MTEPLTSPPAFVPPLTAAPTPDLEFPIGRLLESPSVPLQYRAAVEVMKLEGLPPDFAFLPLSHEPAVRLAVMQRPDGVWHNSMLATPSGRDPLGGVGTVNAVIRLLEYGWSADMPPLLQARRILFRLLAEDEDPNYAFELIPKGKADPLLVRHARMRLREGAAAALARAGYEADPRLRGAATRMLDRVDAFIRSPLAEKPFTRVGNQHVLAEDAHPPSFHMLVMLAHMPLYRSERYDSVERLHQYLTQSIPRTTPAVSLGKHIVEMPQLMMGDPLPHRTAADADLPWSLVWLELAARLGFLRTNENWLRLYERLLDDRGSDGVWSDPRRTVKMRSESSLAWPWFPLVDDGDETLQALEVTFRLGLIGRIAGRAIVPK